MKNIIFLGLITIGLSMSILTSCNTSDKNNKTIAKELELQKRELDLKQKKLELKEKELAVQSKDTIENKTKITKQKTDHVSINNSKCTVCGIIKSVDFPRNWICDITIVTQNSSIVLISFNPQDAEWNTLNLDNLKEGVKISATGKWEVRGNGEKQLTPKKIKFI